MQPRGRAVCTCSFRADKWQRMCRSKVLCLYIVQPRIPADSRTTPTHPPTPSPLLALHAWLWHARTQQRERQRMEEIRLLMETQRLRDKMEAQALKDKGADTER